MAFAHYDTECHRCSAQSRPREALTIYLDFHPCPYPHPCPFLLSKGGLYLARARKELGKNLRSVLATLAIACDPPLWAVIAGHVLDVVSYGIPQS